MRCLGAIETTFWPRCFAQRAFCEAEILARAAALIVPRPRVAPVLLNPLSALIAVSNAFTCWATLSRSAFNCAIMSMCSSPGEDCNRYGTCTGQTTVDKYQGTGVTQDEFNAKVDMEETFINNFRIIGQGSGNNFLVHETFHVTINANGSVTAFLDNFSIDCR